MHSYSLQEFHDIRKCMNDNIYLDDETMGMLSTLNDSIVPIVIENKNYNTSRHDKTRDERRQEKTMNKLAIGNKHKGKLHDISSWKRQEEFKVTQFNKPVIKSEQILQSLKMSFNKISDSNFDNQILVIKEKLEELMIEDSSKFEKAITIFFETVTFNHFYSEVYAKLYKNLLEVYPILDDYNTTQMNCFATNIKIFESIDSDDNYDLLCKYNKEKDNRFSFAKFFVNLMKNNILSKLRILNLITGIQDEIIEESKKNNNECKVDELVNLLYIFLFECGNVFKDDIKTEWIWKYRCLSMIEIFLKYKKGDVPSLSSRSIFKFMDIKGILNIESI